MKKEHKSIEHKSTKTDWIEGLWLKIQQPSLLKSIKKYVQH
jgi:hypothetical protein